MAAVCHHGGAGTTAIGLRNGLPTIVIPFFGDQKFWGDMIHRAGGGPAPIPQKELTPDNLAEAIRFAVSEPAKAAALIMGEKIRSESGEERGVASFHNHLPLMNMRYAKQVVSSKADLQQVRAGAVESGDVVFS